MNVLKKPTGNSFIDDLHRLILSQDCFDLTTKAILIKRILPEPTMQEYADAAKEVYNFNINKKY